MYVYNIHIRVFFFLFFFFEIKETISDQGFIRFLFLRLFRQSGERDKSSLSIQSMLENLVLGSSSCICLLYPFCDKGIRSDEERERVKQKTETKLRK